MAAEIFAFQTKIAMAYKDFQTNYYRNSYSNMSFKIKQQSLVKQARNLGQLNSLTMTR